MSTRSGRHNHLVLLVASVLRCYSLQIKATVVELSAGTEVDDEVGGGQRRMATSPAVARSRGHDFHGSVERGTMASSSIGAAQSGDMKEEGTTGSHFSHRDELCFLCLPSQVVRATTQRSHIFHNVPHAFSPDDPRHQPLKGLRMGDHLWSHGLQFGRHTRKSGVESNINTDMKSSGRTTARCTHALRTVNALIVYSNGV